MEKKPNFRDKHGFCMLSTFKISKTSMSIWLALIVILIIHISMLSPLSPVNSPKSHNFSTMKKYFVEQTFDRFLLLGLSSFFTQNNRTFWKNCHFVVVSFKDWLKCHVWLLWCKVCPLFFEKKAKISKWPQKPENRTNMDMILSFLAKPVDKHGITLVHINYLPLDLSSSFLPSTFIKLNMICLQAFCHSTFINLNMICLQAFAIDFYKVEHDLSSSFLPSTFIKLNMICLQAFCHRLL